MECFENKLVRASLRGRPFLLMSTGLQRGAPTEGRPYRSFPEHVNYTY